MGMGRLLAEEGAVNACYHCVTRIIEKRFAFGDREKEKLVEILRAYEEFSGVQVLTFCIMNNHVHVRGMCPIDRKPCPATRNWHRWCDGPRCPNCGLSVPAVTRLHSRFSTPSRTQRFATRVSRKFTSPGKETRIEAVPPAADGEGTRLFFYKGAQGHSFLMRNAYRLRLNPGRPVSSWEWATAHWHGSGFFLPFRRAN
jgi:hypothetical protein